MKFIRFSFLLIVLTSVCAFAGTPQTGDILELIDVTRLPYLKDGVVTQVSSYDRTGGNDDGFTGKYSHIRKEGDKFVIFDAEGPGCIYRIWSANPNEGRIRFYFDGEEKPRIDLPSFAGMFKDNKYPFVDPIAKNFLGGWTSYIPIPFSKSCKIVTDSPVMFIQINWQKFPTDRQVKTFNPSMPLEERIKLKKVTNAWSNLGANPWPIDNKKSSESNKSIRPGDDITLFNQKGPGQIRALKIQIRPSDNTIIREALLEVYVDGMKQPTVWSPVGDFFLDAMGQSNSQSLLLGKNDGEYYCYFPMPFEKSIRVKITNQSKSKLQLYSVIEWEPFKTFPNDMCRFYAWWHRQNPTTTNVLFPMLEVTGRGHFCGVVHAMKWNANHLNYLEGDEMMWIDGRDNSFYNGTGTEDYFNGGWYFGAEGSAPLYGCGVYDPKNGRCLAYRLQTTDCVPFQQKVKIGIEHGAVNEVNADYIGVSYWYAMPGTTHSFTPVSIEERTAPNRK